MSKPMIAVDIDDVLASAAAGWVAYSNKTWGTSLTVDEYDEDWAKMWQIDFETMRERAHHIHQAKGIVSDFAPDISALAVLKHLSQRFTLVIATSRVRSHEAETAEWINKHFPDIFENIYLTDIYSVGNVGESAHIATKADLIEKIGADYLIDDQLKHCLGVAANGGKAVLFGNYNWNRADELPANVTRCADWQAVQEYFDGLTG